MYTEREYDLEHAIKLAQEFLKNSNINYISKKMETSDVLLSQ
ncbi:hypothetical protein [Leuconostoc rapi]|nr:hypothetical protein [Leuconostoc rapi]MBM7436144.1 hypothetical protein [Leuconostoc rapi]